MLVALLPLSTHAGSQLDALVKETTSGRYDPLSENFVTASQNIYEIEITGERESALITNNGNVIYSVEQDDKYPPYGRVDSCPPAYKALFPQSCYDETWDAVLEQKSTPLIQHARHLGVENENAFALANIKMPDRPEEQDIIGMSNNYTGVKGAQVLCALATERLRNHGIAFAVHHKIKAKPPCTLKPLG